MTNAHPLDRYLARYPAAAVICYVVLVAVLGFVTIASIADLYERGAAVAAASELLDQIEGRKAAPGGATNRPGAAPVGSPFLEGQTVTIAGAALQQRVTGAITKQGGNVLSSQVDLQGTQSKDGFVSLITSCEIEQPALQQLLHDLEAGMPFLFVDQLVVQAPGSGQEGPGARMRVLLAVSGQWQAEK